MKGRIANFSAGPAVLPEDVLREVQSNLFNYKGRGLSVMEMSHRSKDYQTIIDDAMLRARQLMELGDDYEVLFLQGGASLQFLMMPLNLCPDNKEPNYINTGTWATKALKEAKKIGKKMHLAASSEDREFRYIPREFKLSANPAYLHITTNNTIRGTQYHQFPEIGDIPLLCDISSDIFSHRIDFNKFSLIYAGAQKNIGPAGVVMVAIRQDMLDRIPDGLPTMLDYRTHVDKGSMFNTPPSFAIYVMGLVFKWLQDNGGLDWIEERNRAKAGLIYDMIDSTDFYSGTADVADRSLMNVTFRLPTEELEAKFIAEATGCGMNGLKGHRSVGGCRASIYNSLPVKACEQLATFMREFKKQNG
ncbi:MAG: 3-phosphoserine/phosphohydroxythreonine transaminase [Candidatus Cloacimonetes bacterium]|nr:3-phosphoserine/phosphohydroxythreonine transaminase [Candidatus Cloacimonadota bacterium]